MQQLAGRGQPGARVLREEEWGGLSVQRGDAARIGSVDSDTGGGGIGVVKGRERWKYGIRVGGSSEVVRVEGRDGRRLAG